MKSKHQWILSVFDDIQEYAKQNNLPVIAKDLEQKMRLAKSEIEATDRMEFALTQRKQDAASAMLSRNSNFVVYPKFNNVGLNSKTN